MPVLGRRRLLKPHWLFALIGSWVWAQEYEEAPGLVVLDKHNFESDAVKLAVKGKLDVALVKFWSPVDCNACMEIAGPWKKLADLFKHNPRILVADLNCNSTHAKPICKAQRVRKVPQVKYWTKDTGKRGEQYTRGKSFKALERFVFKVAKFCNPKDMEQNCDVEDKELVKKMKGKPMAKLESEMARFKKMMIAAKEDKVPRFQRRIAILQSLLNANEKYRDDDDDSDEDEEL
eukprot:gnl/MRDRNA2_/MRDRNA2_124500_c0_seq1.p1 gnl/MRDRNA2_/MRDRNA2_124500_c0~~gnl/MRDRNA2_/MRDRNA2_124500_c0_seq1.p1  ORF type:complete len:233 (-),score=54.57 gnl/MRDRNA2_/MRDRNA2_124500_c0_seq1:9-707(-)